jgi:hypothetical protein
MTMKLAMRFLPIGLGGGVASLFTAAFYQSVIAYLSDSTINTIMAAGRGPGDVRRTRDPRRRRPRLPGRHRYSHVALDRDALATNIDASPRELCGLPLDCDPADYEAIRERLTALDSWLSIGGAPPVASNLARTRPT